MSAANPSSAEQTAMYLPCQTRSNEAVGVMGWRIDDSHKLQQANQEPTVIKQPLRLLGHPSMHFAHVSFYGLSIPVAEVHPVSNLSYLVTWFARSCLCALVFLYFSYANFCLPFVASSIHALAGAAHFLSLQTFNSQGKSHLLCAQRWMKAG